MYNNVLKAYKNVKFSNVKCCELSSGNVEKMLK